MKAAFWDQDLCYQLLIVIKIYVVSYLLWSGFTGSIIVYCHTKITGSCFLAVIIQTQSDHIKQFQFYQTYFHKLLMIKHQVLVCNHLGQKMREVISIHIGQAGVQMGNACWELYWSVFTTDFIFCLWLLNFVPGPLTSHHFTLSY